MDIFRKKIERIKNVGPPVQIPKDFGYNAFSFFILLVFLVLGTVAQLTWTPEADPYLIIKAWGGFIMVAVFLTILSVWSMVLIGLAITWLSLYFLVGFSFVPFYIAGALGLILSSGIQLVYHWDKVVTLRMGKFYKTRGPGLHFLFPIIDRAADFVDTRIRVTDFSAEKTLTKDTVPVHVDALCFWMVWDAQKAILEVENFVEAITLSAQTALRDAIGRHHLASLLSEREELGQEIQQNLDNKTSPWGVSIMSIEITDIIIPQELEDVMSKQAQAEREKQSRLILSEAEIEVAKKFKEASEVFGGDQTAFQLRAMNMVYEGIRHNKGSLMVLPSSALDQMNLGSHMGTAALKKIMDQEKKEGENDND